MTTTTFPKYYIGRKNRQKMTIPQPQPSDEDITSSENPQESYIPERENEDALPIALSKNPRKCVKPLPYGLCNFHTYKRVLPDYKSFLTTLSQTVIPNTEDKAFKCPHWKEAINEENASLNQEENLGCSGKTAQKNPWAGGGSLQSNINQTGY